MVIRTNFRYTFRRSIFFEYLKMWLIYSVVHYIDLELRISRQTAKIFIFLMRVNEEMSEFGHSPGV